jgi:transposase
MIRLTDEQWERIRNHFPEENIADGRFERKPIPTRFVLEAVLWILNTGAQWHMLPQSCGPAVLVSSAPPIGRAACPYLDKHLNMVPRIHTRRQGLG